MHAGDPPDRERHRVHAQRPGRPVETWRYFEPTFPTPGVADDAERLYRADRRR